MTLVLDANVAVLACSAPGGFTVFGADELVAPPLMWYEARSALHLALVRGRSSRELVERTRTELAAAPIAARTHESLGDRAWALADRFGWGRTHDAEYIALAEHLDCRLVTLDARLRRGADRLGYVITPAEI